jgi:hypothetical protein
MNPIAALKAFALKLRHEEPVAALGTIGTLLVGTGTWIESSSQNTDFVNVHSWSQFALVFFAYAIPAVLTKLQRASVDSPKTTQKRLDAARAQGQIDAISIADAQRREAALKAAQTRKQKQIDKAARDKAAKAPAPKAKKTTAKKSTSRKNVSGD